MINFLFTQTPFKFLVENLWRDEAFSALLAKEGVINILVFSAKDFSPPLYHVLLHIWIMLFGNSEIALRSLSVLFYWATMYVMYLFMINIFHFSSKRSFLYLIFAIINPILLYYSFEARMYTMFAFFSILSFYAFYKKNRTLYLWSTILGLYTHYFMVFIIAAQMGYLLWNKPFSWKELLVGKKMRRKKWSEFISVIRPTLAPLAAFLPWLLLLVTQKPLLGQSFWIDRVNWRDFFYIPGELFTGYEKGQNFLHRQIFSFNTVLLLFFFICVALIFLGYKTIKRQTHNEQSHINKLLFLWSLGIPLVIYLVSFVEPIFLPRYLICSSVGLLLYMFYILEQQKAAVRAFFLLIILGLTISYLHTLSTNYSKNDPGTIIKEISAIAGKHDLLYVTDPLDFHVGEYYFGQQRTFIYGKKYEDIPAYVGKALIPQSVIKTSLPSFPQRAFILKNGRYNIQSLY